MRIIVYSPDGNIIYRKTYPEFNAWGIACGIARDTLFGHGYINEEGDGQWARTFALNEEEPQPRWTLRFYALIDAPTNAFHEYTRGYVAMYNDNLPTGEEVQNEKD